MNRRDLLKGFATVPVVGALAYGTWRKRRYDHIRSHKLARELNTPLLVGSLGGARDDHPGLGQEAF